MVILGEVRIHAPTPRGNTSIVKLATTTVVNVARSKTSRGEGLVPRWGRGGAWQKVVPSSNSGLIPWCAGTSRHERLVRKHIPDSDLGIK